MDRALSRIEFQRGISYYGRLLREARREATSRLATRLAMSAAIAVLTFLFAWVITGTDALLALLVTVCALASLWALLGLWFVLTIPPRIEFTMKQKEETLRVLTERRTVANELRNHMVTCRMTAQQARDAEIQASGNAATVSPPRAEALHQVALLAAHDAEERLLRLGTQTGHSSYESQVIEITGAVNSRKVANVEEAIVQLEALAGVIERQLSSGRYS